jgi:hypothetical protein
MGVLQYWGNDPRVTIPEQSQGNLLASQQRPALLNFVNQPGALSQQAMGMAGGGGWKPGPGVSLYGGPAFSPGSDGSAGVKAGLMGQNGIVGGDTNNRFSGAMSGAIAGNKLGGWPGAIIGGAIGYGANGGVKDANPISASGFGGKTMDNAWASQDIARLASNPAASLASKLGVKSNSVLGTVLDPSSLFHSGGSHKRNWSAFNDAFPGTTVNSDGNYVLPESFGGKVINQKQLDDLAGTWYGATAHPDGDQAGWEQKYNDILTSIYGG